MEKFKQGLNTPYSPETSDGENTTTTTITETPVKKKKMSFKKFNALDI